MLFAFALYALWLPDNVPDDRPWDNKKELLRMGGLSLLLTIENIIIIFVVSRLMFYVKNVYITKDSHEKVWKSVTNFRQNYSKLATMRDETLRDSTMRSIKAPNQGRSDLIMDNTPLVSTPGGTLQQKMRQSVRFAMDYDFDANSGTLKGNLLALNRQRSQIMKNSLQFDSITPRDGSSGDILLDVPDDNNNKRTSASIPSKRNSNKKSKQIDPDSSDSEAQSDDDTDKGSTKHTAINDLFTPQKVAEMATPRNNEAKKDMDFDGVMEQAVNLAVINQDAPTEVEMNDISNGKGEETEKVDNDNNSLKTNNDGQEDGNNYNSTKL